MGIFDMLKKILLHSSLLLFIFCSCTSIDVTKNTVPHIYTNNENVELEILGEIYFNSKDRVGYIEILKFARNLYPECHFVIDIMIDQIITTTTKTTRTIFNKFQDLEIDIVWIMRGTAVKYKNIKAFNSLDTNSQSSVSSSFQVNYHNNSAQSPVVNKNTNNYTVVRFSGVVEHNTDGFWVNVKVGDILDSSTYIRVMSNSILILSDGNKAIAIPAGSSNTIENIIKDMR